MNTQKLQAKRGRPKRKNSDSDEQSDEFAKKKGSKKAQKALRNLKKSSDLLKLKGKKSHPKNKIQVSESSESEQEVSVQEKQQNQINQINVPLEMFKPDKLFAQILNKANKEPQFLIMLRNLLSVSSKILFDKKRFLSKKWQLLRNSNCTQEQYINRESELKRMEVQEIYEIQKDIMSKLSYSNIKGFQSKENIIEQFKSKENQTGIKHQGELQYFIEEEIWNTYHELQKTLLNLLMNQPDLGRYRDNSAVSRIGNITNNKENNPANNSQTVMDTRFLSIETQENPQTTQFLFCKHFSQINYDKVFQNYSNPFKLHENDIYYMDPKALSWILETKSDEIYTNQKFQKETYKRYTEMLQNIYSKNMQMNDDELIESLLEITAYILNSVHYYQKFKLKCDLMHPLDLLLVLQKIRKTRKNPDKTGEMTNEVFDKQIQGLISSVKQISQAH